MNLNIKTAILTGVVFALAVLLLSLRYPTQLRHLHLQTAASPPELIGIRETGPWVTGTRITQEFSIPLDLSTRPVLRDTDPARIEMLLANYEDRPNHGRSKVVLECGAQTDETWIDYASVQDNIPHLLSFEKIKLADVMAGTNRLTIIAEEGAPDSSITAWLTTDVALGKASVNGKIQEGSLVLSLMLEREARSQVVSLYVFAFIFAGLTGVLLHAWFRSAELDRTQKQGYKRGRFR